MSRRDSNRLRSDIVVEERSSERLCGSANARTDQSPSGKRRTRYNNRSALLAKAVSLFRNTAPFIFLPFALRVSRVSTKRATLGETRTRRQYFSTVLYHCLTAKQTLQQMTLQSSQLRGSSMWTWALRGCSSS